MEVGEEGDYLPIATLSPPEWEGGGGGGKGGTGGRLCAMKLNEMRRQIL